LLKHDYIWKDKQFSAYGMLQWFDATFNQKKKIDNKLKVHLILFKLLIIIVTHVVCYNGSYKPLITRGDTLLK